METNDLQQHKDKLKVDRDKILKEISNKKVKKYQLSEILFDVGNKNKLEEKYNIIKKSISQNGFENTALMYGISDTSKNGGKLGWINETAISDKILNQISSLSIGGFTKPITVPGGFLILKIDNISEEQIKTDKEKEVEKIVNIKINEQLNQFSNLYLNKIKKDVILSGLCRYNNCRANSIFLEIFFQKIKKYNSKNPLILIASYKLLKLQMKKLNF